MFKKVFLLSFFIFCFVFQNLYSSLKVTPPRQEFLAKPGESFDAYFEVENSSSEIVDIDAGINSWFSLEENKKFGNNWLKAKKNILKKVKSGEVKKFKFNIKVPKNASGFLVAMVSFIPNTNAAVRLKMSSAVYITISGTEKFSFSSKLKSIFNVADNFQMSIAINNNGNVYIRPYGEVIIKKIDDNLNENMISTLYIVENNPTYPGQNTDVIANSNDQQLFLPGKYVAYINLLSNNTDFKNSSKAFYVIDENKKITVL